MMHKAIFMRCVTTYVLICSKIGSKLLGVYGRLPKMSYLFLKSSHKKGVPTSKITNLFLTILKYASGYEILGQSLANLASKAEEP